MEREIDCQIYLAVVTKELSWKVTFDSPDLTDGHELWGVTGRLGSRIQVAKMSFLCRVVGPSLSLRDKMRSLDIWRSSEESRCSFCFARSQLRWFWASD